MARPLKLEILPSITFNSTKAAQDAARRDINLWKDEMNGGVLPVGIAKLPSVLEVIKVQRSVQGPFITPNGFHARSTLLVNFGGYYRNECGDFIHGIENAHPRFGVVSLQWINFWPGQANAFIDISDPIYGSTTLMESEGDRVMVATEVALDSGGVDTNAECFFSLIFAPQEGFDKIGALEPGIIHTMPTLNQQPDGAWSCWRSEITIPEDAVGGTHLQLYVCARSLGQTISTLGVGVQANPNSPDMLAAPIAHLSSPLTILPNTGLWLPPKPAPAGMVPGGKLLFDIGQPGTTPWVYKETTQNNNSWYGMTSSATNAVMQGQRNYIAKRTYAIYAVRWFTP